MIEELLPAGVRAAEVFDDELPVELFPEEAALMAGSSERRRRQFASVRGCARRALGELGVAPVPLLRGKNGAPRWPEGVVGSMTHCRGYRAAVVARAEHLAAVGIDAEPALPLPEGVLGLVTGPEERDMLARLPGRAPLDRVLFCAKEALYKAWFPLTQTWAGFRDAAVEIEPGGGFAARMLLDASGRAPEVFRGRWSVREGLILTVVTVAR
ncbi:4'-phosphopantetheinyl transferase superfamily protein [Nonomuraea sp. B12E4]|uniref:4'-phosphopantetheinyl transferase family protein n=1 Tax=Nonomuraea sp. B12E4 TaxID=3153564 RepID=UPI00325C9E4A